MRRNRIFLLLALTLWPQIAAAAPFCVETRGIHPQCHFFDATECRRRSIQLSGVCTANLTEITLLPGIGKYCLVYSNRTALCSYADRGSCDSDALRNGGVCIDNRPQGKQKDLYRLDPNLKY